MEKLELKDIIDIKDNFKISIKINSYKNSKEVQKILFSCGYYWFDVGTKYKNIELIDLHITLHHYKSEPKHLTFCKFTPISEEYINIIDYKLIRKYKLNKLNEK